MIQRDGLYTTITYGEPIMRFNLLLDCIILIEVIQVDAIDGQVFFHLPVQTGGGNARAHDAFGFQGCHEA